MRIRAIKLEVRGGSAFLRRRIIPHDLQEAVRRILNDLCEKHMAEPITSLAWSTPTFMPLKSDGKTLSICDDYKLTLNSRLLKKTCTMVKAEDIRNRLQDSKVFSKFGLGDAYLQIPVD